MIGETGEAETNPTLLARVPPDELRLLVAAQAEIVELITANATVEATLEAIVHSCERMWPDAIAAVVLEGEPGHDSLPSRDSLPPGTLALLDEAVEHGRESADLEPVHLRFAEPESGPMASATVIPVALRDGTVLGRLVLLSPHEAPLPPGELAVLRRYTQLARISLEQHRSELHLQRLIAEERQWIAGVLHDDPIQAMTAVNLRIQRLARHADPELSTTIAELQKSVADAIDRMRRLLIDLHPPTLDEEGLVSAIDGYFAEVLEPAGIECELDSHVDEEPTIETASLAYRLIAEALWNAAKHSQASKVEVRIESAAGGIDATIVDDGVGFDLSRPFRRRAGHMGISACRELADRASGSWTLESTPGGGTTVRIHLPGSSAVLPS